MLTPRQNEVLALIIQLYGQAEEPIGSKTLLKESQLKVSAATVRNDMVVLEEVGLLKKAHTSSGRIPSNDGIRYYVDQLISGIDSNPSIVEIDNDSLTELVNEYRTDSLQRAKISADVLVSMTGYTALVLGQDQDDHFFEAFKLFNLDDNRVMAILITDTGRVENEIFDLPIQLSKEDINKIMDVINQELKSLNLADAYQRMKLSIPFMLQNIVGMQLDFSLLIEKTQVHLKGHHYFVSGKQNIFNLIDPVMGSDAVRDLISIVDGSSEMYHLLEGRQDGIEVLFGFEIAPDTLANINLLTGTYYSDHQKITVGLIGPATMPYQKILTLVNQLIDNLADS